MQNKIGTTHKAAQLWLVPKFPSTYPDRNFFVKCKSHVLFYGEGL